MNIFFTVFVLIPAALGGKHSHSHSSSSSSSESSECPNLGQACSTVTCAAWSYEGANGPSNWGGTCGTGTSQSPINLVTSNAASVQLGKIRFSNGYKGKLFGTYQNTGDTALFIPTDTSGLTITGGSLGSSTYRLAQFHFHWGCTDFEGSEHTIDGRMYSLEMHMVHWNTAYPDVATAKTKSDGLAVLGILFKADHNNHEYEALELGTDTVECTAQPNSTYMGDINLGKFIKTVDAGHYFTYPGSLTTPPCSEVVTWTVFPRVITINSKQVEVFRRLKTCNCAEECNTYRPVQALNSRVVKLNMP